MNKRDDDDELCRGGAGPLNVQCTRLIAIAAGCWAVGDEQRPEGDAFAVRLLSRDCWVCFSAGRDS
jgi:hypothetical protein